MDSEIEKDQNLSEVLFKPTRKTKETSFVASSALETPEDYANGNYWYRQKHLSFWGWLGLDLIEVQSALADIAMSTEKRTRPHGLDTVFEYGPGNWIYEFSMLANKYAELGKKSEDSGDKEVAFKNYRLCELYYDLASYPHLPGDDLGNQALLQHYKYYRKAAENAKGNFAEFNFTVEGKQVSGFIHTPDNTKVCPFVLVFSNYLNLCTEYLRFFQESLFPLGIAMVVVDMPGVGLSSKVSFSPQLGKVHQAALDCILANINYLDHNNVGVLGQRLGANAALQVSVMNSSIVKASVLAVPLLDEVLLNKDLLTNKKKVKQMAKDILASRLGIDTAQWDSYVPQFQAYSIKKQGILSGVSLKTPTLVLGAEKDPLFSKDDIKLARSSSSESDYEIADEDEPSFETFSNFLNRTVEFFKEHLLGA